MLILAVLMHLLTAIGIAAMAVRYVAATPPVDYHGRVLAGSTVSDELRLVLGALYKGMGGAFAAMAVGVALLAVFGVWADLLWAKLAILLMALIAAGFTIAGARAVEAASGVRTPWRVAAGLAALSVAAFAVSLV